MSPLTRTGLAALLAAAAATPALAQGYGSQPYGGQPSGTQGYDRQAYPPSTYDRSATSGYQPTDGRSSQYDQTARPGDYESANRYGQPEQYGQDQGGQDPQQLARQLNLSPSQRAAYDSYRRAFQPDQARARQEQDDMARMASLTTPQRLDMARGSLARDRADFDRTDQATRSFYAQLSPGQRRTFDQLTAPQMDDGGQGGPSAMQPAATSPR